MNTNINYEKMESLSDLEVFRREVLTSREDAIYHLRYLYDRCSKLPGEEVRRFQCLSIAFGASIASPITQPQHKGRILFSLWTYKREDYWGQLSTEEILQLVVTAESEDEPLISAHLWACSWENRSRLKGNPLFPDVPTIATKFIHSCTAIIKREFKEDGRSSASGYLIAEYLEVAIFVGLRVKDLGELRQVVDGLIDVAEAQIEKAPHFCVQIASLLIQASMAMPDVLMNERLSRLHGLILQVKIIGEKIFGQPDPEREIKVLVEIEHLQGLRVSTEDYHRRLAEGYMARAEQPILNQMKASYFKDAAGHFQAAKLRDQASIAKRRSREAVQAAQENGEFKEIREKFSLTKEEVEQSLEPYFVGTESPIQILIRLGNALACGSVGDLGKADNASVVARLIPVTPIVDDRMQSTEDPDNALLRDRRWWMQELRIYNGMFLVPAFRKLREEFDFGRGDLNAAISSSNYWSSNDLPFLRRGVEAYFSSDFISAIHIFVPRIESFIRNYLSEKDGDATRMTKDEDLLERTFGQLLREAEKIEILPKKLSAFLQTQYSEEWGFNLRNRVAHGLVSEGECGESTCVRVIHTLLVLSQLR